MFDFGDYAALKYSAHVAERCNNPELAQELNKRADDMFEAYMQELNRRAGL